MSVYYVNGDLLEADVDYICHQVNCQGKMNSGIAKQIRTKWPGVFEDYKSMFEKHCSDLNPLLGKIQILCPEDKGIINMFAQQNYGYDEKRYTSYDAFWNCLHLIRLNIPEGSVLGFPDHIGCGLGGANWEVIRTMIEQVLDDRFEVYIYKLEK